VVKSFIVLIMTKLNNSGEWQIENYWDSRDNFLKNETTRSLTVPILTSIIYLSIVFGGTKYMQDRTRYSLRNSLCWWSSLLALYSMLALYRTSFVIAKTFKLNGVRGVVCSNDEFYNDSISAFWSATFVVSKFFELIDTVFIVLRKQKLIFLHWYHHISVLWFVWITYRGFYSGGLVFMALNLFVHSLMYSYYAIRAYGLKPPRFVNKIITSLQIFQMVVGTFSVFAIKYWESAPSIENSPFCKTSELHFYFGSFMYFSYFVLFMHFYYISYIDKASKYEPRRTETPKNNLQSPGVASRLKEQQIRDTLRKRF